MYQDTGIYNREKEIREAIYAGERARTSLERAERELDSAGGWGILDMFGGRSISGLMKHMQIGNSKRDLDLAKQDLQAFSRELRDVQQVCNINIDIDGFLTFADFFFDGFIADIFIQSKIRNAQRQIQDAITQVDDILRVLRRQL